MAKFYLYFFICNFIYNFICKFIFNIFFYSSKNGNFILFFDNSTNFSKMNFFK